MQESRADTSMEQRSRGEASSPGSVGTGDREGSRSNNAIMNETSQQAQQQAQQARQQQAELARASHPAPGRRDGSSNSGSQVFFSPILPEACWLWSFR